jgi:Sec7-like guanine-nucleotide exchange factor
LVFACDRGLHNGKDFDREYLTSIYNAIKTNEIIMPDEAGMARRSMRFACYAARL